MTSLRRYARLAALATPLLPGLVAGCASPGAFPSLARRPQEAVPGRITGSLAAPATAPAAAEPTPAGTITALRDRASAAHDRFAAQLGRDGGTIRAGRGAVAGSEAWAQASAALADLTGEHDSLVATLAELDGLYAAARIDGGDGGASAAVRDQVTAWVADEDAVLADLQGGAGRP